MHYSLTVPLLLKRWRGQRDFRYKCICEWQRPIVVRAKQKWLAESCCGVHHDVGFTWCIGM